MPFKICWTLCNFILDNELVTLAIAIFNNIFWFLYTTGLGKVPEVLPFAAIVKGFYVVCAIFGLTGWGSIELTHKDLDILTHG